MYYIIRKIYETNGEIAYSNVGYLDNINDKNSFESIHTTNFIQWTNNNLDKSRAEYFNIYDPFYVINTSENISGLSLVTNLTNPEGV